MEELLPAGADTSVATTDIESSACDDKNVSVATAEPAVAVSDVSCEAVADESVRESENVIADDGATETTPRPKAATATSAMRLIVVDICFLSKVDLRNFRRSAWKKLLSSTRFIARADESNSPPCIRTR